ncbi:MAG: 3'-5' exonuclease [Candidatus Doudnabacteria bacterium]|nr:3'-5' exonuclease [Candidatus Doudnabacteria bacterium]
MNFIKDILLIDFETTDIDPEKAQPLQLAGVLLDKTSLQEKDSFSSFIKQDLKGANPIALKVNGITEEVLRSAPTQNEVIDSFIKKFGKDVLLASWVQYLDRAMLYKMIKTANIDVTSYDYYHYLDLWPVGYIYLIKQGYTGGIRSEEMFEALGMPARGTHDALNDCRITADILRKIVNE